MRSGLLFGTLGLVAVGAVSVGVGACLPDPAGDYKDYLDRTAGETTPTPTPPVDAGPIDASLPTDAIQALYVGICLTALSGGEPNTALRFYTESTYTPDPSGGKLALKVTPLLGWANGQTVRPASISKSETRGATIDVAETPVATDGKFTGSLGTVILDAAANSVSGSTVVIEDTKLEGRFMGGDRFCAGLTGELINPYRFTFERDQNICLFVKVKEGDPVPSPAASEFVCPL